MIVQPEHKLLFLAAVLLGADPFALLALLAELPLPTFPQALINPETSSLHWFLNRETSGDGKTGLLHCGNV